MLIVRRFVLTCYPLLVVVGLTMALIVIAVAAETGHRLEFCGGAIATALAATYFFQQQHLEEVRLFKELFVEFNRRYDKLNGRLNRIVVESNTHLPANDLQTVYDYFNLCGEEFLFYRDGYIHPTVWCTWCRGMLYYLQTPCIRDVWEHEQHENCYYGLTLCQIQSDAKRNPSW